MTDSVRASVPGFKMGCAASASALIAEGPLSRPNFVNCKSYRDEHLASRSGAC